MYVHMICDVCKNPLAQGERYYTYCGKCICTLCAERKSFGYIYRFVGEADIQSDETVIDVEWQEVKSTHVD